MSVRTGFPGQRHHRARRSSGEPSASPRLSCRATSGAMGRTSGN